MNSEAYFLLVVWSGSYSAMFERHMKDPGTEATAVGEPAKLGSQDRRQGASQTSSFEKNWDDIFLTKIGHGWAAQFGHVFETSSMFSFFLKHGFGGQK